MEPPPHKANMSKRQVNDGSVDGTISERADGRGASPQRRVGGLLLLLRIGLPGTLATAGLVLLLLGSLPVGVVLLGTAMIAALVDFFARMTNDSDVERERDEQARREFMATGRWPRGRR
jgi:hypothetical protein